MRLSKTFQVDQVGEDINIFVMLMFMLICCVPGFYIGYLSIDDTEQVRGWSAFLQTLGMLGGIFLAVIGMILGFIFWAFFEEYCRKRKGLPALFSKNTLITIDESGINIKGLDLLKWTDIVGLEGVPDDDHTLFLHTAPYGKLLLHHPADELYKVFNHYLNQQRDAELNQATLNHAQNSTVAAFEFKATLFNWPIFLTVIIFGYLIGIAVTGLLLFYANIGFFKNMLAIFLLAPICAYLVWTIPFWQISHFAGKRTKKFVMTQDKLSSKDKAIEVYLLNTKVTFHHKTGIGYKLDFMTIISQNGRRLDLLVEQEELATLQKMQPNDINQQY